jgi:SAM-dependent methyltransferase
VTERVDRVAGVGRNPGLERPRSGDQEHHRRSAGTRLLGCGDRGEGILARLQPTDEQRRELVLAEPEPAMRARLERRAARSGRQVTVCDASAEALPFADSTFDCVVSTMVLCTVADVGAALREIRRVLKPDGRLLFAEHVRSERPALARWQDRLAAPWRVFAAGCRCNQPTLELLTGGGMHVRVEQRDAWRGMPPVVRPLAIGHARPALEVTP